MIAATTSRESASDTGQWLRGLVENNFQPLIYAKTPSDTLAVGIMVGVFLGGREYYFPFGVRELGGEAPDKCTLFQLGSVTKVLTTSILGMQPFLDGISPASDFYHRHIKHYIPSAYSLQRWEEEITFEELATFTAGINPSTPKADRTTQADFIDFIDHIGDPGRLPAANVYSNSSIGLLGQILLQKAGFANYAGAIEADTWFRTTLCDALSMTSTGHVPPPNLPPDHNIATFYAFTSASSQYKVVGQAPWVPWGTAGRLLSNAEDMVRFIMANVGVKHVNGKAVAPAITQGMEQAQHPWTSDGSQGFAWKITWIGDQSFAQKDGGLPGCAARIAVCTQAQCGIVALANTGNDEPAGNPMAKTLGEAVNQIMPTLMARG